MGLVYIFYTLGNSCHILEFLKVSIELRTFPVLWAPFLCLKNDRTAAVVKLHSDLRLLTQLQLVGVGVDFVFPLEGRKKKKKKKEEQTPT